MLGTANTGVTVTVNSQAVDRQGVYWHKRLAVDNASGATYPLVSMVGAFTNAQTGTNEVVTVSTGHTFLAQTPESFTYDDDGNLISDGRWSYAWDAENRLVAMETLDTLPAAVPRAKLQFAYDHMSRRIGKHVSEKVGGQWSVVRSQSFLYDSWAMIRERTTDHGQQTTNSYFYGLDLSGTLQGAGTIGGLLSMVRGPSSVVSYFCWDANGNVGQVVAAADPTNILAHYEYSPFGETLRASGPEAASNPWRFSSKYTDDETGLVYYGYRYYHPEMGRWLSRDPIGEWGGVNLCVFVRNSPSTGIDPVGLSQPGGSVYNPDASWGWPQPWPGMSMPRPTPLPPTLWLPPTLEELLSLILQGVSPGMGQYASCVDDIREAIDAGNQASRDFTAIINRDRYQCCTKYNGPRNTSSCCAEWVGIDVYPPGRNWSIGHQMWGCRMRQRGVDRQCLPLINAIHELREWFAGERYKFPTFGGYVRDTLGDVADTYIGFYSNPNSNCTTDLIPANCEPRPRPTP